MKNQYFGDNRDLFKYDLILQVIQQIGPIKHFTFIPMLTKKDDTEQGGERNRDKAKGGTRNDKLVKFLDKYGEESRRDIKHLKRFFEKRDVKLKIYHGKDKYFSHEKRGEYFKQIGNELLPKSLVLIDPDKGLEVMRTRDEHVKYCEVKNLHERMDKSSILMIFQFIPHVNRETYFPEMSKKLKEKVENLPIYISDNQIVFFFLTKDKSIRDSLRKAISDYKRSYPRLDIPKFLC